MKKIVTLALIMFSISIFAQKFESNEQTDLEVLNLKGKVKSISESRFETEIKNDKILKGKLKSMSVKYFNVKGNDSIVIYQSAKGKFESSCITMYDKSGKITSTIVENIDPKLNYKTTRVYNEQGLVSKYIDNENMNDETTTTCLYDVKGNLLEKESVGQYGPFSKYVFKYDEKGNNIEYSYFENEHETYSLAGHFTYKYDLMGNRVEENEFHVVDSTIVSTKRFSYDRFKRLIKEENISPEGKISSTILYSYDEKGNEVEILEKDSETGYDNQISHMDFTYDDTGNWLSKIGSYFVNHIYITREITYY